ncbi:MAG: 3-deoxy-manno-octulosonate cytidylyltransferase [Planctomycetes bacterium]|nr:3-deoxy-manno-octulosonate cytidylyltransferase [Planctomycetota bacterium]
MNVVICIPARYESTRFPGKMLARDTGKYLIQHTYEQALKARLPSQVIIAADHEKIMDAAQSFGAPCVMTRPTHQSGTDRIAEAVADIDADIVINLQGDEPLIDPSHIDLVADLLIRDQQKTEGGRLKALDSGLACPMATLSAPLTGREQIENPNIVKVITDQSGRAIYFSRSVIPYDRDAAGVGPDTPYARHIGIYAYHKAFLMTLTTLAQMPLEKTEKLEQLRVLEHGHSIQVGHVAHVTDGIDTPEQYECFVKATQASQEHGIKKEL